MSKTFVKCPHCQKNLGVEADIPSVRSRLSPMSTVNVYRITTEEMKVFLQQKAAKLKPGTSLDLVVQYCERKGTKAPNGSKATLKLAFSHHIVEGSEVSDWFNKLGENSSNPTIVNSVLRQMIRKYCYDKRELEKTLNDYKEMERLEDTYGMTESFIKSIHAYAIPKLIPTINGENWIFFAAMPEKVIADMLEDPNTNKVEGSIRIYDVYPINQDNVEYIVYVHPYEDKPVENPFVRKLLLGDKKIK